jgi:hypothetical protein
VYIVKLHLEWLAMSRTGVLEGNVSDTPLKNRLNCLKRAIGLQTNYIYGKAENEQHSCYVRQDLVQNGLISTAAALKPVPPLPVAEDLILTTIGMRRILRATSASTSSTATGYVTHVFARYPSW